MQHFQSSVHLNLFRFVYAHAVVDDLDQRAFVLSRSPDRHETFFAILAGLALQSVFQCVFHQYLYGHSGQHHFLRVDIGCQTGRELEVGSY